jgi:hypothetical protein
MNLIRDPFPRKKAILAALLFRRALHATGGID